MIKRGNLVRKGLLCLGAAAAFGTAVYFPAYAAEDVGFYQSAEGTTRFADEDGNDVKNEVREYQGKMYYLDKNGTLLQDANVAVDLMGYRADADGVLTMKVGWLETADGWYYSAADGTLYHDMVLYSGEEHYYLDEEGRMVTDAIVTDGTEYYYAGSDGTFLDEEGWISVDGKWYYVQADGILSRNKIVRVKGHDYYMGEDAVLVTNSLVEFEGKYYYANGSGAFRTKKGWLKVQGSWYYIENGPAMAQDFFVTEGTKTYYLRPDAKMAVDEFADHDGEVYYITKAGVVRTKKGWRLIGDDWYYFQDGGALVRNDVITSKKIYCFDESGRMVVDSDFAAQNGKAYHADADGVAAPISGWFQVDGIWFLAEKDGTLHRNEFLKKGGVRYHFNENAAMDTGFFYVGSKMYYASKSGSVRSKKGWLQVDGKWYFSDSTGAFYRSITLTIKGEDYYFNAQGIWSEKASYDYYTGIVEDTSYTTIDGKRYHVNDEGEIDSWFGIDVSAWNGDINWKKVAADGVDFAIVRVGGRFIMSTGIYDDSKAVENIMGAYEAGIPVGVYFYTGAVSVEEAYEEADFVLEKIKGLPVELPIVIDSEYAEGGRHSLIDRQTRTDVINAFCRRVEEGGYRAMYYAGMAWCENHVDTDQLDYMHWCAQWWIRNQCDDLGIPYQVWQYTDVGHIDGIKGNVDCNIWYRHQTKESN